MKWYTVIGILLLCAFTIDAQTFSEALEQYFVKADLSKAEQFIGCVVSNEEMKEVAQKYPGDGLRLSNSKPHLGVSIRVKNSKAILYSLTTKLIAGKSNYEIWDLKGVDVGIGCTLYAGRLMRQSLDFPKGNMEIDDAIGLLVIKNGEKVPEEKRIVPNWILTADKEGRLLLSKPKDNSEYLYLIGGPI